MTPEEVTRYNSLLGDWTKELHMDEAMQVAVAKIPATTLDQTLSDRSQPESHDDRYGRRHHRVFLSDDQLSNAYTYAEVGDNLPAPQVILGLTTHSTGIGADMSARMTVKQANALISALVMAIADTER